MRALKQNNGNKCREGEEGIHPQASPQEPNRAVEATNLRGHMHRVKRMMAASEAGNILKSHKVAHAGTVDVKGWPYVDPLVYVYEGGDLLYFHTGAHQGHFLSNIQHDPRICVEVGEIGPLHRTFQLSYPLIDQIILYEQQMEIVTGKHSEGLYH